MDTSHRPPNGKYMPLVSLSRKRKHDRSDQVAPRAASGSGRLTRSHACCIPTTTLSSDPTCHIPAPPVPRPCPGDPRERPSARGAGGLGRAEGAHRGGRCRLEGVPQGPSQHHRARHVPQVWFCFALFFFSIDFSSGSLPSIFRRRVRLVVLLRSSNFLWSSSFSYFCHIFRSISSCVFSVFVRFI